MDLYNFTRVSNHDLDGQVSCIKQFMPDAGQSMVKGADVSFSGVQESLLILWQQL